MVSKTEDKVSVKIPTQEFLDGLKPFQEEYLSSNARQNVLMWHRGSRKTSCLLNKLIIEAIRERGLYWYIAPYLNQAKSIVWIDPNTNIFRWIPSLYLKRCKVNHQDLSITFPNGSVLQLKGADHPDSLRGPKPLGIGVDEYGEVSRRWGSELRESILEPSLLSSGGWIDFAGTPRGKNDFTHLLDAAEFSQIKTVEDTGMFSDEDIQRLRENAVNIDFFYQEYYCRIIEGASSVFKGIDDVTSGSLENPEKDEEYVFGIDLARSFDATAIVGIKVSTNHVVFYRRLNDTMWSTQKTIIKKILSDYNGAMAFVDATGVGDSFVEQLLLEGVPVQPIKIQNNVVKRNLIERLATYISDKYITFPNEEELIQELKDFEFTQTKGGVVEYSAPNGKHDDSVLALSLAISTLSPVPQRKRVKSAEEMFLDARAEARVEVDELTGYLK